MWVIKIRRNGKSYTKTFPSFLAMMEYHCQNGGEIQ